MNRSRQADIDEKIDELYGLPLDEFTAARNALAKEHPEVKSLAKPSLAAWAANQAVRRESAAVKDLLAATERLRDAYAAGGADLRAATQAERDAVRRLDEAAEAALREAGRNPSTGLANKIRDTFRSAAGDDATRPLLERGRFERELEPSGFGALTGVTPKAAPRRARSPDDTRKLRKRVRDLEAVARQRRQRATVAEVEAERAEAAAAKARAKATEVRKAADHADAAVSEARAELESE